MAFADEEIEQYGEMAAAYCDDRIPPHVRDKLWMGYRIEDQSITLLEFRPHFQDKSRITMTPVAKTTFIRKTGEWRIYWMRRDLKWHGYAPCPAVWSFEEFLEEVDRDELCCFFG
jgi:hypothetical protein